jgi:hypothetical protein
MSPPLNSKLVELNDYLSSKYFSGIANYRSDVLNIASKVVDAISEGARADEIRQVFERYVSLEQRAESASQRQTEPQTHLPFHRKESKIKVKVG